ncbi:MAG TPA: hypothetical protein VG013_09350 [Gemmataceae bacterium]|jgi:hypothetical protein|nr:hypothetical protein [Gemmataceae bacterium]
MKVSVVLPLVLVLGAFAIAAQAGEGKNEARKDSGKRTGLERIKQLAGEWVGKEIEGGKEGNEVHVKYKVTSHGSAVVETLFPDTEHEMVTVIHQDGDDLVLTHYCALGNQPQMRAAGKGDGNQVAFKFTHATNLKSEKDMHMHDVTFTFVAKDKLKAEWTNYNHGKPAGKVVFELKRKK